MIEKNFERICWTCCIQFCCKFRQLHLCLKLFKLVFISHCYHERRRGELFWNSVESQRLVQNIPQSVSQFLSHSWWNMPRKYVIHFWLPCHIMPYNHQQRLGGKCWETSLCPIAMHVVCRGINVANGIIVKNFSFSRKTVLCYLTAVQGH